jgi:crossover junction endodeoxyribonuclease RuvC
VTGREQASGPVPTGGNLQTAGRAGVRAGPQNVCLMLVLGIDPGTASTGFGLAYGEGSTLRAIDQGMIFTRPGVVPERRLAEIYTRVCELLDHHRPDALAIEELYFGANVQTAFAVGQARGVMLLAAGQRGVPTHSYTPQQVKSAVCGSGSAPKQQVGRMVARLLALDAVPTPDHVADALAVAICELNAAPLARTVAAANDRAGAAGGASGRLHRREVPDALAALARGER